MINYTIHIDKDHSQVKVHYSLQAIIGGTETIAGFQVWVDGEKMIGEVDPGNVRFFGTNFSELKNPTKDVAVSFSLTSNQEFEASDSDILRGDRNYDTVEFHNQ